MSHTHTAVNENMLSQKKASHLDLLGGGGGTGTIIPIPGGQPDKPIKTLHPTPKKYLQPGETQHPVPELKVGAIL